MTIVIDDPLISAMTIERVLPLHESTGGFASCIRNARGSTASLYWAMCRCAAGGHCHRR